MMKKINKLDDLKKFKGELTVNPQELYDVIKANIAPNNYEAFVQLINTNEELQEAVKTYSKIEENTYAQAVHQLIQNSTENQPTFTLADGSTIYRPLTFKENIVARIEDNDLFSNYLHSCTGVAHKKKSSLIKLNPEAKELITIPQGFNKSSIAIDYNAFEGEELDVAKTSKQDKWLIAMGGINSENKELFKNYQNILHERTGIAKNNLMNFYTVTNPSKDQLRALFVNYDGSYADGDDNLDNNTRLLRVD